MVSFGDGMECQSTITLKVVNQGAIKMARNNASENRTKHIDIRYYLVRDMVEVKKIEISYCLTNKMVADIFTKPLAGVLFKQFQTTLGLQS